MSELQVSAEDSALIIILLPVYNGERFLASQLDSILAQTWRHILIICRDDGSTDASSQILAAYARSSPEKFRILDGQQGNVGASANFSLLMQNVVDAGYLARGQDTYISLADQDDIWYPEKLARCLEVMRRQERETPGLPVAVHSDLRVVA